MKILFQANSGGRSSAQSMAARNLIVVLPLLLFPLTASAQRFTLDWFSADGGGGTSTGGVYSVSGTIGQPDAGTMNGGQFSLSGGFWSVVAAIQTPDAPRLSIVNTGTNVVMLSWASSASGFVLQQNDDLNTTNWMTLAGSPTDDGTNRTFSITRQPGNWFFRLIESR